MPLPTPADLIGTADPAELADRWEDYKDSLSKAAPIDPMDMAFGPPTSEIAALEKALGSDVVQKALGADVVQSVQSQLQRPEIQKDLTLTYPVSSGLVAFDLEAPSKKLFPRMTPLRNRIVRRKGIGTAHRFKKITGITGSGTAGLGLIRPGITDASTEQFGNINYLRGPKIEYAGADVSVPYKQFSMSDSVPWSAQFSGQGFEDIRQLSQTSVLYASMLAEERLILGGRGVGSGFAGALTAPTAVALGTPRAPAAGETGLSGVTTNIYVKVTAESVWGESVLSATANVAVSNGQVVDLTVTLPAGATGVRVYVGTGASEPADTAKWYLLRSGHGGAVIQGALPTSGTPASSVTADTSAAATDYDGLLTYCTGPDAGYVNRINSVLSGANPGAEFFTAFEALWESVKADPDEVLANGSDRKQLSDLLKTSNSSNYRITIANSPDAHTAQLGALVNGLQNEVTGKMVDVTVHPWLPQGNMPIISWTLPIPDTQVSEVFAMFNVQDYMSVQWPVSQFAYEVSSYWYGTMINYAPAWCGAVTGIKKA